MNTNESCTRVLYDGSCPLCSKEISIYQNLESKEPIEWVDITQPQFQVPEGQSHEALMKRFHVIDSSGRLISGAQAFVVMWAQLPGWHYLALMAKLPGVLLLMEGSYRLFLKLRPGIQRVFRALEARKTAIKDISHE